MNIIITRLKGETVQTRGNGKLFSGDGKEMFSFKTLELPWLDNKPRISCIPTGEYNIIKYDSPKFSREVFLLKNVIDREMIEIHAGNYYSDILGCILVGETFTDINNDGYLDVKNSGNTLNRLLDLTPNELVLTIE